DRAVLDHRQEAVLLGTVEAMDLVDEQHRSLAGLTLRPRGSEGLLAVGNAGKDSRELLEVEPRLTRYQPRHGRLASTRRPPENKRSERPGRNDPCQGSVGPKQVILADDV